MALLMDYSWPGNVRELENTIEYAAILEKGSVLTASSLPDKLQPRARRRHSLKERLEGTEKQIIIEALSSTNGVEPVRQSCSGLIAATWGIFSRNMPSIFPFTLSSPGIREKTSTTRRVI